MARDEVDLGLRLADPLIGSLRPVSGVVTHHFVRLAERIQALEVVVDLADRAARVVLTGKDEDRHADVVDIGQRRALVVHLAVLFR